MTGPGPHDDDAGDFYEDDEPIGKIRRIADRPPDGYTDTPLAVGDVLHGFCGGAFGRDALDCKRVEALGPHWVVARNLDGRGIWFTTLSDNPLHGTTRAELARYRAGPAGYVRNGCSCEDDSW